MSKAPSGNFNAQAVTTNDALPTWDLSKVYPSYKSPEFESDFQTMEKMINDFAAKYEGKVASLTGADLAKALEEDRQIDDIAGKLFTYVGLKTVQDNELYGEDEEALGNRATPLFTKMKFFFHEIKTLDEAAYTKLKSAPALEKWVPALDKARKDIPHMMALEVQKYAGELSPGRDWNKSYDDRLVSMEFEFEGKTLKLEEILEIFTGDKDRERRAAAHKVFQEGMKQNDWYFADVTNALIRLNSVNGRWTKFDKPWESRHFANGIEPKIVDALENAVKSSYVKTSHRFYALKAKLMELDHLEIYDRNINVFQDKDELKIPWDQARTIVLEAFKSFSQDSHDIAKMFFDNGWIDAAPGENKAGGAFAHSGMARAQNPYVMVNYRGTARDVATLAHELGHGVHQYLESKNDRAVLSTPLTLAETASVFAEMLTFKSLLTSAQSDEQRRKMLFEKINDMINTVVRQVSFYDFEKRIHGQFQNEQKPLKKGEIGAHWVAALQDSYGPAIPLDEDYGPVYGYIGHFIHTPFYVYAYAFGDSLVNALYQVYEEGTIPKEEFKDKYTKMLTAGGTYTFENLKDDFGLDVQDPAFWNKGLNMIEGMITELETLCQPILDQKLAAKKAAVPPAATAPEAGQP